MSESRTLVETFKLPESKSLPVEEYLERQKVNAEKLSGSGLESINLGTGIYYDVVIEPFALDTNFPGQVDFKGLDIPSDIKEALSKVLNYDPRILLSLDLDDTSVAADQITGFENLDDLSKRLLMSKLHETQKVVSETVYFSSVLSAAGDLIVEVAPNLESMIEEVVEQILFTRIKRNQEQSPWGGSLGKISWKAKDETLSGFSDEIDAELDGWFFTKVNDSWCINVNDASFDLENLQSGHALRTLIMAHELLHALVAYLFKFEKVLVQNTDLEGIDEQINEENPATLGRVILEGISLALEHEILQKVLEQKNLDQDSLTQLTKFGQERLAIIRKTHHLWQEKQRRVLTGDERQVVSPAQIEGLAYSDGVRLALALRRKDWTLNDLPELVDKVKALVGSELKDTDPDLLMKIELSDDKESKYQKLFQDIRRLKN